MRAPCLFSRTPASPGAGQVRELSFLGKYFQGVIKKQVHLLESDFCVPPTPGHSAPRLLGSGPKLLEAAGMVGARPAGLCSRSVSETREARWCILPKPWSPPSLPFPEILLAHTAPFNMVALPLLSPFANTLLSCSVSPERAKGTCSCRSLPLDALPSPHTRPTARPLIRCLEATGQMGWSSGSPL